MRNQYLIGFTIALLLLSSVQSVFAGKKAINCRDLSQFEGKIERGDWLRVTSRDGKTTEGYLGTVIPAQSVFFLTSIEDTTAPARAYEVGDVSEVQFRKPGKVKAGYVVVGLVAGVVLGTAIGSSSTENDPNAFMDFSQFNAAITGAVLGGLIGLTLGAVASTSAESTWTVRCE